MRSLSFRFDDLFAFARVLGAHDQEMPLPAGESVGDGEWVLAIFEIGERKRATAAAARGLDKGDGTIWLGFERRDWERLRTFAEAKSEKTRAVAPASPLGPYESLPVTVGATTEVDRGALRESIPRPPRVPRGMPPPASPQPATKPASGSSSGSFVTTPSGRFQAARDARVLLVDDDADTREVVGAMLEAVGLIVEPTTSAELALERVREQRFDLLVLDWNLPGMTGLELCRRVRAEPTLSAIPVLFLTAHSSSKDIVDAFASGADDYVAKPFRAPELGARIFGLLRRARVAPPGG